MCESIGHRPLRGHCPKEAEEKEEERNRRRGAELWKEAEASSLRDKKAGKLLV